MLDQNKIMRAINTIEDIAREPLFSKVRAKQESLELGDSIEQAARDLLVALDDCPKVMWAKKCRDILVKSLTDPRHYCEQLAASLKGFAFCREVNGNNCHAEIRLNDSMVTVSRYDWDELIVALETIIEFC